MWVYDFRTNIDFTLKTNPLRRSDLDDFVSAYKPKARREREENERFRRFFYDDIAARDKTNLDIFWLKDANLEESANLPVPEVLAASITGDLESALEAFRAIAEELEKAELPGEVEA